MNTEDIPLAGPSDWRREPSERATACLGKLGEEASELASRLCRAIIQGLDAQDPDSGRTNKAHIEDEIADVLAMIDLSTVHLRLDAEAIQNRYERKRNYKAPWIEALPK